MLQDEASARPKREKKPTPKMVAYKAEELKKKGKASLRKCINNGKRQSERMLTLAAM